MSVGSPSESPSVAAGKLLDIIEARFGAGLATARPARSPRPRPDAESLRRSYLDLLKICLTDLAGARTLSVARTTQGHVMSRQLEGEEARLRAVGMDWPLSGLTMVGLNRLDDLQRCVETIVADGVPGDLIEAGAWRGGASILMRATLDSLGADDRTLWVADSFQGFPQAEEVDRYDLGADLATVDFLAIPEEEVRANFARFGLEHGVTFVPGFFQDTLPTLGDGSWALVRLDGDSYDATWAGLESLYPGLAVGGYLVVDDYQPLDECRKAVDDFRARHGIDEPIEQVDWSAVRWRREHENDIPRVTAAGPAPRPQPIARPAPGRVPAMQEYELRHELEDVQRRLAAAEAELEWLKERPWRGPRRWLGRMVPRRSP
jgi:Macrocin-O-methyltransferase (TylF)